RRSDRPAVRGDVEVSAAFLSREGVGQCCVEFSWLREPQRRCWSHSLPTTHSPAAGAAVACAPEVSTAAEPCEQEATVEARSRLADTGAALSRCAAGELPMGAPTVATAI